MQTRGARVDGEMRLKRERERHNSHGGERDTTSRKEEAESTFAYTRREGREGKQRKEGLKGGVEEMG